MDKKDHGEKRALESEEPELPQELKDKFKPLHCELCNVELTSTVVAYTHYIGKPHLKNINAYMMKHYNKSPYKKSKQSVESFHCEICNVDLSSTIVYQQHLAGKQHKKNLKRDTPIPPKVKVEEDPTGRFGIGKSFLGEADSPEQNRSEQVVKEQNRYYCELCQVYTSDPIQLVQHKQGKKHIRKAKLKCTIKSENNGDKSTNDSTEYYNEEDVWQATPNENNLANIESE